MTFTDKFKAKYSKKPQNLPISSTKKPSLVECRSCGQFEEGPNLRGAIGKISWCVFKEFDKIKKRPVTHYANIELLEICPKKGKKRTFFKKL
jgi:hypothetical protein